MLVGIYNVRNTHGKNVLTPLGLTEPNGLRASRRLGQEFFCYSLKLTM